MRNVKTSDELTRGKGLSEMQWLVWLMSTTQCRPLLVLGIPMFYRSAIFVHMLSQSEKNQSDDILTFLITAIKLMKCIRTPQKQESCVIIMTPLIRLVTFPRDIYFPRIMRCAALRQVSLLMRKLMSISERRWEARCYALWLAKCARLLIS